jgi:hypothetical protein
MKLTSKMSLDSHKSSLLPSAPKKLVAGTCAGMLGNVNVVGVPFKACGGMRV